MKKFFWPCYETEKVRIHTDHPKNNGLFSNRSTFNKSKPILTCLESPKSYTKKVLFDACYIKILLLINESNLAISHFCRETVTIEILITGLVIITSIILILIIIIIIILMQIKLIIIMIIIIIIGINHSPSL